MTTTCAKNECSDADCVELTDRESSICGVICASAAPVSFGKLRESTGLHQEIVSRIVHRLMIHGLVRKTDGRYVGECGQ